MPPMEVAAERSRDVVATNTSWRRVNACGSLDEAVRHVAASYDFSRHPYVEWMTKQADVSALRRSQVPFRFAVEAFSQSLAAVLARIPRVEERIGVADNVAEEHGRGDPLVTHKQTFIGYLRALGAMPAELDEDCPVVVSAFNHAVLNYCLAQPHPAGAALLGMIEHLYVGISGTIGETIVARGWVAPGAQQHYETHRRIDVEHAEQLLARARPTWPEPTARACTAHGLLLGAHWFWRLYLDLLPCTTA
jgi:hypothetical protein